MRRWAPVIFGLLLAHGAAAAELALRGDLAQSSAPRRWAARLASPAASCG